jgi:hypothetical protein
MPLIAIKLRADRRLGNVEGQPAKADQDTGERVEAGGRTVTVVREKLRDACFVQFMSSAWGV